MITRNSHAMVLSLYLRGKTPEEIVKETPFSLNEILQWHYEYGYSLNKRKVKKAKKQVEVRSIQNTFEQKPEPETRPKLSPRFRIRQGRYQY